MMELEDYRELVKRYNPPPTKGVLHAYAVDTYARLLKYNELSVSQTIIQLMKDKAHNQVGLGLERPPIPEQSWKKALCQQVMIASIFIGLSGIVIYAVGYLYRMARAIS